MGFRIGNEWRPDLKINVNALSEGFDAMGTDALAAGRPIHEAITNNADIDGAFDSITYGKGGHVVAMVAAFMGDETFQKGVQLHMDRYAYKNATTEQFFGSLADAAGDKRLLESMKSFIDQQGVPVISLHHLGNDIVATQSRFGRMGIAVKPQQWIIPVCVRRNDVKSCTLMDQKTQILNAEGTGVVVPNAGGTGYYRFNLEPADWQGLFAQADTLSPGEGLATLDSLWAQFSTGDLSADMIIEAARAFAANPDSEVATLFGNLMADWEGRGLISEAAKPQYRKTIADIYGPHLKTVGFGIKADDYANSPPAQASLRQGLTNLMAFEAKDLTVRAALKAGAGAYLSGDKQALAQAYRGSAMAVYVADSDPKVVKDLYARMLDEKDERLRRLIVGSLAYEASVDTAQWLIAQFGEAKLKQTDKLAIIGGLMGNEKTRDLAYGWIVANYDDMTKGGGIFSSGRLAAMPGVYCSVSKANEVEAYLRPKVIAAGRGDLSFNRMLESVRTCGIIKDARSKEISTAFEQAH
jgi:aminopeptidase N